MKIRLIWDDCTPTRDRRPTTIEDIEDDIHIEEFDSEEEFAEAVSDITGYDLEEAEGDTAFEKAKDLMESCSDIGDGSPNFLYLSVDGKEDSDATFAYDCLDSLDLEHCTEEEVIEAAKSDFDFTEDNEELEDYETSEEESNEEDEIDTTYKYAGKPCILRGKDGEFFKGKILGSTYIAEDEPAIVFQTFQSGLNSNIFHVTDVDLENPFSGEPQDFHIYYWLEPLEENSDAVEEDWYSDDWDIEEDEDNYNELHAQEWMEKHPHGYYNNENDYGEYVDDDLDESCKKELKEELSLADAVKASYDKLSKDYGVLPTADDIAEDIIDSGAITVKIETPEDAMNVLSQVKQELDKQGLDYLEDAYTECLHESFNQEEYDEFLGLCKDLGFETVGDIDHFSEEHDNVTDHALLQALRDEKMNKEQITEKVEPEKDYVQKCREFYGKCAHLDEGYELKEEDINDYALNKTACYMNCDVKDLKEILLNK